jgi:hypothetical protein
LASEGSDWSDAEDSPSRSRQFSQMPDYGDHVDSVTDLVLFEGEEEERTAAEVEVSAKLKKEGKLRRALSRRGAKPSTTPAAAPLRHANQSSQRLYESPQPQDSFEALPLDNSDDSPTLVNSPYAPRSHSYGDIGYKNGSPSLLYDDHAEAQTLGDNSSTRHLFSGGRSQRGSIADLAGASSDHDNEHAFFLDVTEAEQQDLEVVAELARPGYPRLEQILDDEVQRSAGKTIVACKSRLLSPLPYSSASRSEDSTFHERLLASRSRDAGSTLSGGDTEQTWTCVNFERVSTPKALGSTCAAESISGSDRLSIPISVR